MRSWEETEDQYRRWKEFWRDLSVKNAALHLLRKAVIVPLVPQMETQRRLNHYEFYHAVI